MIPLAEQIISISVVQLVSRRKFDAVLVFVSSYIRMDNVLRTITVQCRVYTDLKKNRNKFARDYAVDDIQFKFCIFQIVS